MCRWLAYQGPEIYLADLIVRPTHSLLVQSQFAQENFVDDLPEHMGESLPTNGDGFGIGWYGESENPGRYRELRPAWSDENLISIANSVRSRMFLAHLRAASQGVVQRTNSHPFTEGRWLFQHNGEIIGFRQVHRALAMQVAPEYFNCIQGTTDSELMFYLALSLGLEDDPKNALEAMVGVVEKELRSVDCEGLVRLTAALADGDRIYAVRYASSGRAKSLYRNKDDRALLEMAKGAEYELPEGGQLFVSEPLDYRREHWEPVPDGSFAWMEDGHVEVEPFNPSIP